MHNQIPFDPEKHFGFPQCEGCIMTPCMSLRYGLASEGEYTFIHRRWYGYSNCPLGEGSIDDVIRYLKQVPLYKLKDTCSALTYHFTENEKLNNSPRHFVQDHFDSHGYISFIVHLLKTHVIAAIGIPFDFERNEKIRLWFYAFKGGDRLYGGETPYNVDLEGPALTDEMAGAKKEDVTLSNPRWEHSDEVRKDESAKKAAPGDKITLLVSVSGLPHGAGMEFFIYDISAASPKRIATVDGKNENGTGKAQWVVDAGTVDEDSELKLAFEAKGREKYSAQCEIAVGQKKAGFYFSM